ncbi:aliphatic sulfonate ABC transporter substrate-binding protein [Kocuria koreensis]|uniref:Putative aliphatic sulfonates-binding protein n=1 Tax=Rothia koreensis TaxID=592378 RepID=A0A7K1LK34_9MICC|nr:aliphatic sulfonate ABC transporter substrate-binding protein [Rothia koreensis]MUN55480.1 aliphatic sulfonate ABC transporter substrate-binding protein [Rothia koreensis]
MTTFSRRDALKGVGLGAVALTLSGCMSGEGAGRGVINADASGSITLDYATYNPLSLIMRKKKWLETAAEGIGQSVSWLKSAGSNKANQSLIGAAIDVGSTAGSAALLARANGAPITTIGLFSQPEWSALARTPDSPIRGVEDLAGRSIAATLGTDPYFLLIQALDEAGMSADDVTIVNLQHADGRSALDTHQVDAWAGLDPIMATAQEEGGDELFYRNLDFNTWGFLNAREEFLDQNPEGAQLVIDMYAFAREWAISHREEAIAVFAEEAGISDDVARTVWDRTHLDIDPVPGDDQLRVLRNIAPILVDSGDVSERKDADDAVENIIEKKYARAADASAAARRIKGK